MPAVTEPIAAPRPPRPTPPETRPDPNNTPQTAAFRKMFSRDSKADLVTISRSFSDTLPPGTTPAQEAEMISTAGDILAQTDTLRNFLASVYKKIAAEAEVNHRTPKQLQVPPDGHLVPEEEYVKRVGIVIVRASGLFNDEIKATLSVRPMDPRAKRRAAETINQKFAEGLNEAHHVPDPTKMFKIEKLENTAEHNARIAAVAGQIKILSITSFAVAHSLVPPDTADAGVAPANIGDRVQRYVTTTLREASRTDGEGTFDHQRGINEARIAGNLDKKKPTLKKTLLGGWESTARFSRANNDTTSEARKAIRAAADVVIRTGEFTSDRVVDLMSIYGFMKTASLVNSLLYLMNTEHDNKRENVLEVLGRWGIALGIAVNAQARDNYRIKEAVRTGSANGFVLLGEQFATNAILGSTAKMLKDRVPASEFGSWSTGIPFTEKTLRFSLSNGVRVMDKMPRREYTEYVANAITQQGRRLSDMADVIDENATRVEYLANLVDHILPEGGEFNGIRRRLLGIALRQALTALDRFGNVTDTVSDLAEIPDVLGRTAAVMAAMLRQEIGGREIGGTSLQRLLYAFRLYQTMGSTPTVRAEDLTRVLTRAARPVAA